MPDSESDEKQTAPKCEPGPRPRINLRGVMRSISLLEPEGVSGNSDLPEVSPRLCGHGHQEEGR